MYECFRPGDIVLADVLSLGDARSYFLSTAKNELGVVHAKSLAGGSRLQLGGRWLCCARRQGAQLLRASGLPARAGPQWPSSGAHRNLAAGAAMEPVSWQEMICPETKVVEKRKVAKVASLNVA